MNDQKLALYLLVAAETFHSAPQFMPDLQKIDSEPFDENVSAVRHGEIYAGGWTFIIAVVIAHVTNSTVPLVIWLAVSAALYAIYEYHLSV